MGKQGIVSSVRARPQIVLDQHDGRFVREVNIGQVFQDVRIVDGGVAVRHLDVEQPSSGANSMNRTIRPLGEASRPAPRETA
jgi:hypothetical protein